MFWKVGGWVGVLGSLLKGSDRLLLLLLSVLGASSA